jgi:hypothetical protein
MQEQYDWTNRGIYPAYEQIRIPDDVFLGNLPGRSRRRSGRCVKGFTISIPEAIRRAFQDDENVDGVEEKTWLAAGMQGIVLVIFLPVNRFLRGRLSSPFLRFPVNIW